jgi:transmembrane sensor
MTRETFSPATLRGLTPAQAAARWMACEDRDQSPRREEFARWLADNEDNRAAWLKAQQMWNVFDDAEDNDLIAAMGRAARLERPERARPFWPQLIAASIALIVVSGGVVGWRGGWFKPAAAPTVVATNSGAALTLEGPPDYVTGAGQKSIVDLPDGTRVTLDANSAVDVAFADGRRDVRLVRGQAYFDVAHDARHPFAVSAGGRVVTALGTQFTVALTPGAVKAVLAEGRVSVASPKVAGATAIILSPGQSFAARDGAPGLVATVDLDEALAWKQGVVEFHDQPLSEAISQLNRYTRAQIIIKDPKVAAMRITGVFRTGDIPRFGRSVSQVLPVRLVARGADSYELVARR